MVSFENNLLSVKQMERVDFLDFSSLYMKEFGPLKEPTKNTDGEKFVLSSVMWFRFLKSNPFEIQYKETLNEDSPFKTIVLLRAHINAVALQPRICYENPRPISEEKKHGLLQFLPLVNPSKRSFYQNMPVIEDNHPEEDVVNFDVVNFENIPVPVGEDSVVESLDDQ